MITILLDDDPTGTQTVFDITVLTVWTASDLVEQFQTGESAFFILTNTRALTEPDAYARTEEITRNLTEAARQTGQTFRIILRGDSTLRGHFPAEMHAVEAVTGPAHRWVIMPYFREGGRLTLDDVHYVQEGEQLVPAAETPFARDASFGYQASDLRQWVAEKTGGQIPADTVSTISLDDIRAGGPNRVAERLREGGRVWIANATEYTDAEIVAEGCRRAEDAGLRILYRTAASFVQAYLSLPPRPALSAEQLVRRGRVGGLIVVGSYVPKTTAQLMQLLQLDGVEGVEFTVESGRSPEQTQAAINEATERVETSLREGRTTVLYSSRTLVTGRDAAESLRIGNAVSSALVAIVGGLVCQPAFLIAKGGITSSDTATEALRVRRATVMGQALPGVPVWKLGPESRCPGLSYIVFPGNVGDENALVALVEQLQRV